MKKTQKFSIFLLSQPLFIDQWTALMGDKYRNAFPFEWGFTDDYKEAQLIAWDGSFNDKSIYYYGPVLERIKSGQAMLAELPKGNILPEDLLQVIHDAHKKLNHV